MRLRLNVGLCVKNIIINIIYIDGKIIVTTIERDEFGEMYKCERHIAIDEAIRLKNELETSINEAQND